MKVNDEKLLNGAEKLYKKREELWIEYTKGKMTREEYEKEYNKLTLDYYNDVKDWCI